MSPEWLNLTRDGVRLACLDFGGEGPPVLILPGLAGHAGEWAETAGWLSERAHVLVLDARGQGHSERNPDDVSPEAHVADTAFAIEQLGIDPAVVIGHSLGGQRALVLAAEHPDLVCALVVADAAPDRGDEETVLATEQYFRSWPVPFESQEAAVEFFGGPSLKAEMWADGLEQRDNGWWPRYDISLMTQTLREAFSRDYWEQWDAIRCPTMVARALISKADLAEMTGRLPETRAVTFEGADHDIHLDRPDEWRQALTDFHDNLDS